MRGMISISHLQAFTLFESVVAISVISILLLISTMIYSNVIGSEKPVSYYQVKQEIDGILIETKKSQAFFNKNFSYENYSIEQTVEHYKGNKKLLQLSYTVRSANDVWWIENHLVANRQNVQ
jgi:prepilin-type N-terminal cleavage/methylation domain-containing protein